jgi:hypothetical protein
MTSLPIIKEQITLSLLAADIPIQACLSNWFGSGRGNPSFAPLVDFQWPGFLGIPIQYRVVLVGDCPREFKPDDMYGMESQWPDFHLIFIASERPAKVKVEYACQWFTIEEFIQAVERIPKSGNPFSLKLRNFDCEFLVENKQPAKTESYFTGPDGELFCFYCRDYVAENEAERLKPDLHCYHRTGPVTLYDFMFRALNYVMSGDEAHQLLWNIVQYYLARKRVFWVVRLGFLNTSFCLGEEAFRDRLLRIDHNNFSVFKVTLSDDFLQSQLVSVECPQRLLPDTRRNPENGKREGSVILYDHPFFI